MVEKKETEVIESQNVVITEVVIESMPQQVNQVKRVRFVTTEHGDITWKPKKKSSKFIEGMKLLKEFNIFCINYVTCKAKNTAGIEGDIISSDTLYEKYSVIKQHIETKSGIILPDDKNAIKELAGLIVRELFRMRER